MPITLRRKTLDEMKKDAISDSVAERGYKKGGMVKKPTVKKAPGYAKGGMTFKPCAGCPNPAKCKAMGKCMKKAK
jgi:hypothetical protein